MSTVYCSIWNCSRRAHDYIHGKRFCSKHLEENKSRRQFIAEREGLIVAKRHQELANYIFCYLEVERDDNKTENWFSPGIIAHAIDAFKGGKN